MKIGFIGTGVMGCAMAHHFLKAGNELYIYNRTKSKAKSLIEAGATWCDDVKTVAKNAEIIFTIIGMPKDVENVYLNSDGLINNANKNTILVDMTTSTPELAKTIFEAGQAKNIHCIDAPVTGGDIGAKNATLTIFVGGEKETYQKILPFLNTIGKTIVHLGPAGSGQHGKMANQIAIAGSITGMAESLTYAKNAGLDLDTTLNAVGSGSASSWQLNNMGARVIKDDFEPGFYIKHFIKDMKIAENEAKNTGITLPGLKQTLKQYEKLAELGLDHLGTQALYKLYNPDA